MADHLTNEEHEAVKAFIEEASKHDPRSESPTYGTAVKFLLARKFDVKRAVELYNSHEQTRIRERLADINPFRGKVKAELLSGKFTILPARDSNGAAIALFSVRLHDPVSCSRLDLLRALLFQLDAALESINTQRCGLVFIYDMTDSKFHNFDFEISKKILSLLKDGYPARLKKVIIVSPPVWFKYPFKCLQILLKKKLQERVHMVNANQLTTHLPVGSIPVRLGGHLEYNHNKWLESCLLGSSVQLQFGPCDVDGFFVESYGADDPSRKQSIESSCSASQQQIIDSWPGLVLLAELRQSKSIHLQNCTNDAAMTIKDFVAFCDRTELAESSKLYAQLKISPPGATYNVARRQDNLRNNRYNDVPCLDATRVRLLTRKDEPNDYIHANFVDGYDTSAAYICTQGPLPHTTEDFWRMIWDYHVLVVVMLTKLKESGRVKCHQYWPLDGDLIDQHGDLAVISNGVSDNGSFICTSLLVQNVKSLEMREVLHMQFVGWPDYGVPHSSENFLNFLLLVKKRQDELYDQLKKRSPMLPAIPPILVHCSAGIGRSGTLVVTDISIDRLTRGDGTVDVSSTVERVRLQRPGSVQTPDQFLFCHTAVSHFARSRGLIEMNSNFQDGFEL